MAAFASGMPLLGGRSFFFSWFRSLLLVLFVPVCVSLFVMGCASETVRVVVFGVVVFGVCASCPRGRKHRIAHSVRPCSPPTHRVPCARVYKIPHPLVQAKRVASIETRSVLALAWTRGDWTRLDERLNVFGKRF